MSGVQGGVVRRGVKCAGGRIDKVCGCGMRAVAAKNRRVFFHAHQLRAFTRARCGKLRGDRLRLLTG